METNNLIEDAVEELVGLFEIVSHGTSIDYAKLEGGLTEKLTRIADQSKREQLKETMHEIQVIYTNPNTKDFAQALKNAGLLT